MTLVEFLAQLIANGRVMHNCRTIFLDKDGIWGCDEYGQDTFFRWPQGDYLQAAFSWVTSEYVCGQHPAEFSY